MGSRRLIQIRRRKGDLALRLEGPFFLRSRRLIEHGGRSRRLRLPNDFDIGFAVFEIAFENLLTGFGLGREWRGFWRGVWGR